MLSSVLLLEIKELVIKYRIIIINKMSLVIHGNTLSPNCDQVEITVEFLVIHYTAAGLSKTLDLFQDPGTKASSHLVVDRGGTIYELVSCLEGRCFKAWHAGESSWWEAGRKWKQFNDFSIGVELVNKNGNLFEYTKKQYHCLTTLIGKLKKHYPALENPERILGHEHIAGYRGKVDPGYYFDWPLFFKMNYPRSVTMRKPLLSEEQRKVFFDTLAVSGTQETDEYWIELNNQMESRFKKR